jgi:esterase/lipase
MPKIHTRLGSGEKEMIWIENSDHVISRDATKERVFQIADAFIRRATGSLGSR